MPSQDYLSILNDQARKDFLGLTIEQEKRLIAIYKMAGEDLIKRFNRTPNNTALKSYLYEYKRALDAKLNALITDGSYKAAAISSDLQQSILQNIADHGNWHDVNFKDMFSSVPDDAIKNIISGGLYEDGKGLSKRIWNATAQNGRDIKDIVTAGMINNRSALDIAKALEGYVNPEASKYWERDKIKEILGDGYSSWNKRVEYNALRVARTTYSHSATMSTIQSSKKNPFVKGIKWTLSASHYQRMHGRKDICDEYATQNNYGLGSGVFPIDEVPFDHPNGLCYQTSHIGKSITECGDELMAWLNGSGDDKLDNWYENVYQKEIEKGGNGVANNSKSDIMKEQRNILNRSMANGNRISPLHILNDAEIKLIENDAKTIKIPLNALKFNVGSQTGFSDSMNEIRIRGDILPDINSSNNRDLMSQRAVLAHEYYGHYCSHPSNFRVGDWRDEFRASYKASINAPNLTDNERRMLMIDAYDRAKESGIAIKHNREARRIIYGYE